MSRTSSTAAAPVRRRAQAPAPVRKPAGPPPLVVVPPRFRRRRAAVLTALGMLGAFAVMLGLVLFQTTLAAGQGRLDELERRVREQQVRYDRLRGEVAVLESPSRIVEAARAQGMVQPPQVEYVTTPPEAVAAVAAASGLGPAAAGASGAPATGPGATSSDWSSVKPIVGGAP